MSGISVNALAHKSTRLDMIFCGTFFNVSVKRCGGWAFTITFFMILLTYKTTAYNTPHNIDLVEYLLRFDDTDDEQDMHLLSSVTSHARFDPPCTSLRSQSRDEVSARSCS